MFRIKSNHRYEDVYWYELQVKRKFLFFSYWSKIKHFDSYHQAEEFLPIYLQKIEEASKTKYYFVTDDKIICGNSEKEALKKSKLKVFL